MTSTNNPFKRINLSKKGQVVILDLIIALIIFLMTVIFILATYSFNVSRLDRDIRYNSLAIESFEILDFLVKSGGYPNDWNITNVKIIGLASGDRRLSTIKIQQFAQLNYTPTKELLGIAGKEFFLQIRSLDNINLFEAGVSPLENNTCNEKYESITLRRAAFWEGQRVTVYFSLWNDDCDRNASAGRIIYGFPETYISVPADSFEEDGSPAWTTQVQTLGDYKDATALDESLIMPDYIQFDFPNLGILPNARITNVTFKVWYKEYFAGGVFQPNQPGRHELQCWNGNWIAIGSYPNNNDNFTYVEHTADLSNCITSVALANNINVRLTYDPAYDAGGEQDVDYARVIVNAE